MTTAEGISRLREMQLRARLTMPQLAVRAGLDVGAVRRFERGQVADARIRTMFALVHALGLAPVDILPSLWAAPAKPMDKAPR